MKKYLLLCIAFLLILSACGQTKPKAPELPKTEFDLFYEEFQTAVSNQDMDFIEGLVDDDTSTMFGRGPAPFQEHWEYENEHNGRDIWTVLEELTALGGVHFEPGEYYEGAGECFVAPYTFFEENFKPDSYRMCIMKKDSGWKLLFLMTGE